MRAAIAHRHTKPLAVSDDDVRAHRARRLDKSTRKQVCGYNHPDFAFVSPRNGVLQGLHPTPVIRILQKQTEGRIIQVQVRIRPLLNVNTEMNCTRTKHSPSLGEDPIGHHKAVYP